VRDYSIAVQSEARVMKQEGKDCERDRIDSDLGRCGRSDSHDSDFESLAELIRANGILLGTAICRSDRVDRLPWRGSAD
jgi:hypothetical protein